MTPRTVGSIFILGGGKMQLPAITAAGDLGIRRHMADGNADCLGKDLVEQFHHVDLRDLEGLLGVARGIDDLRGVFTTGTDFSQSVAYITEQLDLPGIPYEVAHRATDKGVMREALRLAGVRVPRNIVVESDEAVDPPFPPPYVVKPVDNMGARGVVLVRESNGLISAIADAHGQSRSGRVIIEQYITGREYSLDALVFDGTVRITGIGERHIFFEPYFVELGHTMPADIPKSEEEELVSEFTRAIRALGIACGAAKGDVFLDHDDDGVAYATIGEVAARLSGGYMSGWTYPLATGVPLTRLGVEIAIGDVPESRRFEPHYRRVSAERALTSGPGTVELIESDIQPGNGVQEVFVNCSPGERVAPPRNNVEKVANVITVAENRLTAERYALEALDRIVVVLRTGDDESDRFFLRDGWTDRYSRYRVQPGDTREILSQAVNDPVGTEGVGDGHVLRVCSLRQLGGAIAEIVVNQISISPQELIDRLVAEGTISISPDASAERSILFWRALIAGGRQGVRYLMDSMNDRGER